MLIEMHAHSSEHSSCSAVSAVDLVRQVFAKGLQGIVFTDHHYLWPDRKLQEVRKAAQVPEHFLIMSGQEVNTQGFGDVLVYGAGEVFARKTPITEIRDKYPSAAIIWAHPYRNGKTPSVDDLLDPVFDGIEIFNSNHSVRENSRGLQDWHRYRFTAIGGTDTHGEHYAGLYPSQFDHPIGDIAELALELKQGRCRPFFKEIPRSGANSRVTEVTIGTKGTDEQRERIIIRTLDNRQKWKSAERAFHIMEAIAQSGFGDGPYRIPRPIDQDGGMMTLIEQGVRGKSLYDKMLSSTFEDGRFYLEQTARWLARLHECRLLVTPGDEFVEREMKRLGRYLERFTDCNHPQERKARELMEAVHEHELRIIREFPEIMVQGHGDFHPKNVIVGQDNQENRETLYVAAIDFESSYVLPRAFDVGCFVAQFRNQFFREKEILERFPEELFISTYLNASTGCGEDFHRQIELFRARANLSIAAYLIKVGMGDSEDLWRVLVEAERAISIL